MYILSNWYLTVWGFTIVFPQVPLFQKLLDSSIHLLILAYGQFVTIKTSQGEFSFGKTLFQPETTYFTHKDDFSWQGTDPQMSPICSEWYSQSDRRKILEPPWSVLDTEPHGPKTLDTAPKCGIKYCTKWSYLLGTDHQITTTNTTWTSSYKLWNNLAECPSVRLLGKNILFDIMEAYGIMFSLKFK